MVRYTKRAIRRRPAIRRKKVKGHLSKLQRKEVKSLVAAPAETKYAAEFARYGNNFGVSVLGVTVQPTIIAGGAFLVDGL